MNDERAQTIKKGNRTAELASKPLAKKLKHWAVTSSFLWVCHISQCLPDSSNTALHTLCLSTWHCTQTQQVHKVTSVCPVAHPTATAAHFVCKVSVFVLRETTLQFSGNKR